jgi:hypothetical protein
MIVSKSGIQTSVAPGSCRAIIMSCFGAQGATGWAAAKASDFAADFQFEIVKKSRGKSENHRKIRKMSLFFIKMFVVTFLAHSECSTPTVP